ncbi:MAG: hypothetical protein JNM78_01530 [Cyclobacteriaceae bacterium]|nr:hypothetical protein [Cyclobacteriaceae bacterium]
MKRHFLLWCVILFSCGGKKQEIIVLPEVEVAIDLSALGKEKLSDYGFFVGALNDLAPADDVMPYSINSALFSDYAFKRRFIKIPAGGKVKYSEHDVFEFPEGTVLIKNFYYPADFSRPDAEIRILETRLLINEGKHWQALPYVWNDEQTEAYLMVAGKTIPVSWKHSDGVIKNIGYSVPNLNQCSGCHLRGDKLMPIGPTARQLNGVHDFTKGKNQLAQWTEEFLLDGVPDLKSVEQLVSYEDPEALLELRARAWLEINCAHCHRVDGAAKNSGLHLLATEKDPSKIGIGKAPVAAGKGSGGLLYDIVPGKPDESILQFRIESTHPGIMMPELGRTITHAEGVTLVRQWIKEMK